MRLPCDEKHVKYIYLTGVKDNSLIEQQQRYQLKKKIFKLVHVDIVCSIYAMFIVAHILPTHNP